MEDPDYLTITLPGEHPSDRNPLDRTLLCFGLMECTPPTIMYNTFLKLLQRTDIPSQRGPLYPSLQIHVEVRSPSTHVPP